MYFRIVLKMTAISGFLTALELPNFVFWGSAVERSPSAPPDSLAGLRGVLLLREWRERKGRNGVE